MTARMRLDFVPEWQGAIEGWVVNYIKKNLWRVTPDSEFEDLYQDAFHFFLICKERYPDVTEPAHFMSLFKTCLHNHVWDLAMKRSSRSCQSSVVGGPLGEMDLFEDILSDVVDGRAFTSGVSAEQEELELKMLLEDAPEPIAILIREFTKAPKRPRLKRRCGVRETTNDFLCRIAGLDPTEYDLVRMVRDWFSGERRCTESAKPCLSTSPTTSMNM